MKNVVLTILLAAAPLFAFSQNNRIANPNKPQAAHVDYYLKLDGIDGESTDAKCRGCIDIESFSWGASNPTTSAGGNNGGSGGTKPTFSDMSFSSKVSKASPDLTQAAATGQHIKEAKLTCRKAGGDQQEYLTYTLENVLVSSYSSTGNGGNRKGNGGAGGIIYGSGGKGGDGSAVPTESFSLNFTKITFQWTDANGKVKNLGTGQTPESVLQRFIGK